MLRGIRRQPPSPPQTHASFAGRTSITDRGQHITSWPATASLVYTGPMSSDILSGLDFSKWEEPDPFTDMRRLLEGWLHYQRHEFLRKLRDLTPDGLVSWSIPPVELSVIGLLRHMREMEHVYLSWGLGGGERAMVYGDEDYAGATVVTIEEDLGRYFAEVEKSDLAIAALSSLDSQGSGHGRPLGATLVKMIDEYALHSGEAHMLRYAALGEIIH